MAFVGENEHFDWGRKLFLKEEFSDVEILVETDGSICRYPCHRVILSSASEVFAAMLNSNLSEGETGRVTIKNISPDIVLILLTYIYSGSVDFDCWKTAIDVLRAAHKYQIESLIKHCEIYLSENLTLRNVCYILDIAIMCDLCDLKTKCKEICQDGGFLILKSRPFKHLSACAVKEILSGKSLVVETKIDVFKALWEWATTECCRKQMELTEENILDEFSIFSEYVKYESMTNAELDSSPESTFKYVCEKNRKMLTNDEKVVEKKLKFVLPETNTSDITKGLKFYFIPKFFTLGDHSPATSMTNAELDSLPESTFKYVCEKNRKMLTNDEKVVEKKLKFVLPETNTSDITKGLKSYLIPKFFTLGDHSPATSLEQGIISLLRFSVDTDVYLADFVLRPLYDYDVKSYFKSLRLVCKDRILAEWFKMGKQMLKLNNTGTRFVRYDSTPQDLVIQVYGFVILKAGVEYTMEVEPEVCNKCPLQWPSISLIDTEIYRQDDVKLFVHSKYSFGVVQMHFLRSN